MMDTANEAQGVPPLEKSDRVGENLPSSGGRPSRKRLVPAVNWRLLLTAPALLFFFILLLAFVQWGTPALVGTDGYYHARMGYLIRHEGLTPEFKWLPLTILNDDAFYDHHLLYHLLVFYFVKKNHKS